MREEPVISRGLLKLLVVLLVAGGLGAGAYALAQGVDLPDIDIPDETSGVTTLENTNLEDTTINGGDPEQPEPEQPVPAQPAPSVQDAQKLNECVRKAGDDSDAVFACFDEFQRRGGA